MKEIEPPVKKDLTVQEEKEIIHWVLSHQSFGEVIVSLNRAQQRRFIKEDTIGLVRLPKYEI